MLCGHTHIRGTWRVGSQLWINQEVSVCRALSPGVPGLPANQNVAWSEFAILAIDGSERSVELRRVPLDIEAMLSRSRESGMPHQAWWQLSGRSDASITPAAPGHRVGAGRWR